MYDICIIGAGQSGLTTIKTFSDQNIICLEKSNSNGMFKNIKEKNYFEWSSSKYMSAFSDFPMKKETPSRGRRRSGDAISVGAKNKCFRRRSDEAPTDWHGWQAERVSGRTWLGGSANTAAFGP